MINTASFNTSTLKIPNVKEREKKRQQIIKKRLGTVLLPAMRDNNIEDSD